MPKKKKRQQFAALPYRIDQDNRVAVLLVTSRETRRWVIPKGWPMQGRKPHEAAAIEALEEAGAVGKVRRRALGRYDYDKRLSGGALVPVEVAVFPLEVAALEEEWPEAGQRVRQWFDPEEAASLVEEPGLAELIQRLKESSAAASKQAAG